MVLLCRRKYSSWEISGSRVSRVKRVRPDSGAYRFACTGFLVTSERLRWWSKSVPARSEEASQQTRQRDGSMNVTCHVQCHQPQ